MLREAVPSVSRPALCWPCHIHPNSLLLRRRRDARSPALRLRSRPAHARATTSAPMLNRFTQFNFGATIQHLLNKGEEQLSGLSIPDHWKTHLEKLPAGEKRTLDRYFRSVKLINDLEPQIQRLADEELKAKTDEFRARLAKGETLDDLLVEAFAVVREVARRVLSMRHFDVQLVGGMVLHEGQIAEMQTGEGKTLVATLPAYLNALEGKGVHIVTVNDYLAQRDAKWMGKVFKFLGLTVAVVTEKMEDPGIKLAFQADVTYITSQQLCFTYLRDNMTRLPSAIALTRPLHYAIVDEADNVLIDECRNPMLISTVSLAGIDRFQVAKQVADKLIECKVDDKTGRVTRAGHYLLDRRQKSVVMNEDGLRRALDILGETGHMTELEQRKGRKPEANDLWDDEVPWGPFIVDAVRAKELYLRDVDYIVRDGEAQIINPSTGRVMPVSRWTDNIHQAVEAKEGLEVRPDNMTQASVTFQCFFRYYQKLCGMTGTAATEASEFYETYGLNVARVPTNKPIRRLDNDWLLFLDEADKIDHIGVTVLRQYRGIRRPVLIGTTSVQESDKVAAELRRLNVPYRLLNARPENVRKEAAIIAQAGYPGSITIATNMAGRGTDIILGGNPKGLALTYLEMACMPLMLKDPKEHDGNMKSPLPHWPKDKAKAKAKDITKAKAKDKAKDKSRPGDVKVTSPRAGKVRKEGKADNLGEMEDYLPDEVVGKLKRVRAEIRIRLKACGLLMEFSDAQLFLQRGVDRAEELRLLLIAGAKAKLKSEIVTHDHDHPWTTMNTHEQRMDYLNEFCEADKSFSSQDGFVLEAVAYAALALWLWLDEECEESGEHVRELGGLLVIGASMQDCIRNENQLKGRAGRQGDPGESQMMADMDDKMLQFGSIRDLMNQAGLKTLDNRLTVYEGLPGKIAKRVCDGERRKQEGWMRSLREDTKRYDEVMEVFRQHAYSLRRLIVCGTPAQRTDILHSYMQDWADSLVDECVDPRRRPADWDWAVLAHKIRAVVNPPPPPIPPPLPATAVSKPGGTALTDTDPNAAAAQTVDVEASTSAVSAPEQPSSTAGTSSDGPASERDAAARASLAHVAALEAVPAVTEPSRPALPDQAAPGPGLSGGGNTATAERVNRALGAVDMVVSKGTTDAHAERESLALAEVPRPRWRQSAAGAAEAAEARQVRQAPAAAPSEQSAAGKAGAADSGHNRSAESTSARVDSHQSAAAAAEPSAIGSAQGLLGDAASGQAASASAAESLRIRQQNVKLAGEATLAAHAAYARQRERQRAEQATTQGLAIELEVFTQQDQLNIVKALVQGKPLAVPQSLVPWSIQMKVELADHRRMLSSGEANASRPPLAGQFAPQANALRNHLGELLMVAYAGKKHLIGMIGRPSQPSRPWCRAHAVAFVRNWEKEMMAEVMDALWVDFLRDMQNLQNAVNVRAFSRMEPLAEFRIDAGASFVSLLAAFRAECVIAAFTGPTADARFNVQLAEAQQMVDEDRLLSDAPPVDGPLDAVAKDKGADMPVPQARGATADPSVSLTS